MERQWLTEAGQADLAEKPTTLTIIYSYGDFSAVTPAAILNHGLSAPIQLSRSNCVPANKVLAFFSDPFGNLEEARTAPLHIQHALITPLPSSEGRLDSGHQPVCFCCILRAGAWVSASGWPCRN